jgi:hypothetical protein
MAPPVSDGLCLLQSLAEAQEKLCKSSAALIAFEEARAGQEKKQQQQQQQQEGGAVWGNDDEDSEFRPSKKKRKHGKVLKGADMTTTFGKEKRFRLGVCSTLNEVEENKREQQQQQQQQSHASGNRDQQPVGALTYSQVELFRRVEKQCSIRRSGQDFHIGESTKTSATTCRVTIQNGDGVDKSKD